MSESDSFDSCDTIIEHSSHSESSPTSLVTNSESSDMALSLDNLVALQEETFDSILTCSNFESEQVFTPVKARVRQDYIYTLWQRCREQHQLIVKEATPEQRKHHAYFTEKWFATKERIFIEIAENLQEILHADQMSVQRSSVSTTPLEDGYRRLTQVPPMALPHFSGDYKEWTTFHDYFHSMFITDKSFSNLQRLHYLKSCLDGKAASVLNNIQVTAANFEYAWGCLKARYDNRRKLINVHLENLFSLNFLIHESAKDLQSLLDTVSDTVKALNQLDCPVDKWDYIFVFLIAQRLDKTTRRSWELHLGDRDDYPKFKELETFLNTHIQALDSIPATSNQSNKNASSSSKSSQNKNNQKPINVKSHHTDASAIKCAICTENHLVYKCSELLGTQETERFELIKKHNLCSNCLSPGHKKKDCKSKHSCYHCKKKHHTLLHKSNIVTQNTDDKSTQNNKLDPIQQKTNIDSNVNKNQPKPSPSQSNVLAHFSNKLQPHNIILATTWVLVSSSNHDAIKVRALLDQGSTCSFITSELVSALNIKTHHVEASLEGMGNASLGRICRVAPVTIAPVHGRGPALSTDAGVLKTLTSYTSNLKHPIGHWPHLSDLQLADDNPANSSPIHLVIGADLYGYTLLDGVRRGEIGQPVAQNTIFGWILSGPTHQRIIPTHHLMYVHHSLSYTRLTNAIQQFWEVEEVNLPRPLAPDEARCEDHFRATHSRQSDGRYIVRIPFKSGPPIAIGESRDRAERMFFGTERRLARQESMRVQYHQFMKEYEEMGHMRCIDPSIERPPQVVYLPHHPVVKTTSSTTKLRVVFNASARTSNGTSLNDHQHIGPKLQNDLSTLLTRWRSHRYVYTADVEKMYRQILVDLRDVDYQRILWRYSESDPLREYQLLTVTYGTASAPYLALRVLQQLVEDHGQDYPLAAPVVRNNFYVDDCLFGSDDMVLARQTRDQLISLLRRAGLELRKWASNSQDLLSDINSDNHGLACDKDLKLDDGIKILGLRWVPATDSFVFSVEAPPIQTFTKRLVLSVIARLFDPLGWLAPVVISAKMIMQTLWKENVGWDDPLSDELSRDWLRLYESLPHLNGLSIPRWTGQGPDCLRISLHGFSDASETGYAAVIYLRTESFTGEVTVSILLSKTRVAPLKSLSIPKLELCAAALLAKLMATVMQLSEFNKIPVYCWSESTTVISWITHFTSKLETFVANRVSSILTLLPGVTWHHVKGVSNPADIASRGVTALEFCNTNLWWHGPAWLCEDSTKWPLATSSSNAPPVTTMTVIASSPADSSKGGLDRDDSGWHVPPWLFDNPAHCMLTPITNRVTDIPPDLDATIYKRFSSWTKLLRVTAVMCRWLVPVESRAMVEPSVISATDIQAAILRWSRILQRVQFPQEISQLQNGGAIASKSALASLNPKLDDSGVIRVHGRLDNTELPHSAKHPIILRTHYITRLIVIHAHLKCLHGGLSLTLKSLRDEFWVVQARKLIKSVIHHCVPCARIRADNVRQLMGQLPAIRVTAPDRPFVHCGLDYAGPMQVRLGGGRGHSAHPAYLAIFICMATKAIHLEIVTEYTTDACIAALERFCARRGTPTMIYSDCGTNFQGASGELSGAFNLAVSDPKFQARLANDRVSWSFIPPAAPHFGGLWEAGIRSVKKHIKRVIGAKTPTLEELITLTCNIEACLNSRPLAPITDAPDSLDVLTPAHFLIGGSMKAIPRPSILDCTTSRLSRWQVWRQTLEQFWRCWSDDYVRSLQQRSRWRFRTDPITPGQIVLLRNENLPPTKWNLARVISCNPGADGLTRVVTIRTADTTLVRPITKLALLPVHLEQQNAVAD